MLEFMSRYAGNIHSQNGEDLIVKEVVRRIGIDSGRVCEVGSNDGLWLSNSRHLIENGWSATLVESDWNRYLECKANWKDNDRVRVQCCHVNGQNVNAFVGEDCDVLSSDTDGADYEIFKGLKAKPKIVIVEIDSGYLPADPVFNRDGAASYTPMAQLGMEKGYFLLCHVGNLIFVDRQYRDLFPEIVGDGLSNSELYFNSSWLEAKAAEAA